MAFDKGTAAKTSSPILAGTAQVIVIEFSFPQYAKTSFPKNVTPLPILTVVRLSQSWNVLVVDNQRIAY